jgi:RNA polymerase sigma factor (sigma-70 family)
MGSLERPSLDPRNVAQVREVLESCPDLDLDRPIGRGRFQRLLFDHASFRGTGASLLRWLGVPMRRGAFESFIARFNAQAAASRILERDGAPGHDESSYLRELELFSRVLVQPAPDGGRPAEAFVSSMRALTGRTIQNRDAEQRLMLEDLVRRIFDLFEILDDRERDVLVRRLGLDGTGEETYADIGARYGLSQERIRQIVARAVAKLRRKARIRGLDGGVAE